MRFTALLCRVYRMDALRMAYFHLKHEAAPGVDGGGGTRAGAGRASPGPVPRGSNGGGCGPKRYGQRGAAGGRDSGQMRAFTALTALENRLVARRAPPPWWRS